MDGDLEQLGERIAEQAAHFDAAMHRILADLREFDQRGGWHRQGAMTCAHWLSWRVGWDLGTARDRVRVAKKLGEFPTIDDALRRGELSYSKVRALVRVATPANEVLLLEHARLMTAAQLEKLSRKYAVVQRHGQDPHPLIDEHRRFVRRRDTEDGMVKIEAVLHPEEAELVWTMLNHAAARIAREPTSMAAVSAETGAAMPTSGDAEPPPQAEPKPERAAHEVRVSAETGAAMPTSGDAEPPPQPEPEPERAARDFTAREVGVSAETGAAMPDSGDAEPPPQAEAEPEPERAAREVGVSAETGDAMPDSGDAAPQAEAEPEPKPERAAREVGVSAETGDAMPDHADMEAPSPAATAVGEMGVCAGRCEAPKAGVNAVLLSRVRARTSAFVVAAETQLVTQARSDASGQSTDARDSRVYDSVGSREVPETSLNMESTPSRSLLDLLFDEEDAKRAAEADGRAVEAVARAFEPRTDVEWSQASAGGRAAHGDQDGGQSASEAGAEVERRTGPEVERRTGAEVERRMVAGAADGGATAVANSSKLGSSVLQRRSDATKRGFSRADALVSLAQGYLRGDQPNRSPVEIMLTISDRSLRVDDADPTDVADLGDGFVSRETARRLSCDAGVIEAIEGAHGEPLSLGRKRRTLTGALKRALRKRDTACTFPGCGHKIFLEGHHIQHWADGGETSVLNATLLCSHHHRYVHEYGYTIELGPDQRPRFRDPGGRLVMAVPEQASITDLGWPTIRAANEALAIDAETTACGWDGGRVDYGAIVGHLVAADEPRGDTRCVGRRADRPWCGRPDLVTDGAPDKLVGLMQD